MQKKMELNSDIRVYFDMDGTIAKWCDVPVEESRKPGYYADLEPETELLDFMRAAMKRGEDIYILSSYYTDTRALLEKKKWLDQYLRRLIPRTVSLCRTERIRQSLSRQCCIADSAGRYPDR